MDLFSTIKTHISTIDAAERYGIEVNRHGKALCPCHNDRSPSLYVTDDHYYCFGCGEHGDSISLVAKLFGLPMYRAAQKLAADFGLDPYLPIPKAVRDKQRIKSEAQQLTENERLSFPISMTIAGSCNSGKRSTVQERRKNNGMTAMWKPANGRTMRSICGIS